ncbi:hypothetical protein PV326_013414 [Microctonus aethiopoides]|nr:hypothetical protein PV326_013414 [Microctonus aethiopoides]
MGGLTKSWVFGILGFLIASLMIINIFITDQFHNTHMINITVPDNSGISGDKQFALETNEVSEFLIYKKGCRMPAFDPMDLLAKRFIQKEKPLVCEFGSELPLIESNETAVFINPDALGQYYNTTEVANCCWRSIERENNSDNSVKLGKECHKFQYETNITEEFVKIECFKDGKQIYRDYHFFVPRKPSVEERCRYILKKKLQKARVLSKSPNRRKNKPLSVLILGIDSVSRGNFHRMMPKTVKILNSLGAIEMMGYNKIGDNTYPNLVAVLSGRSDIEIKATCWNDTKKPFDDCPFLWKNYSQNGYRTVLAEDASTMTTFNYLKPGFRVQPTDYYYRPYSVAIETDIGNTHKLNADLCVGNRKTYANLLHYSRKIAKEFSTDPYFAFFWQASLTHDFFNYPQLGDDVYHDSIEYLKQTGLLDNTALIMMSDHGIRWGEFRQTYQGRIEESLPFVFIILPDWWKTEFPTAWINLRRNTASLTTPFDLHETLLDILKPQYITTESINARSASNNSTNILQRGISWFLPIPDERTCSTAGIPGHWCMCHTSNNISIEDEAIKNTTRFLIDELNLMVKKFSQCSPLTVQKVFDAKMWSSEGSYEDKSIPWIEYTITIETIPGNAIFEASIRHNTTGGNALVGSISRLNAYGKQSACIDDSTMRLYCYCK